jgi:RimJ/RimL family protein N-acetyltransferase
VTLQEEGPAETREATSAVTLQTARLVLRPPRPDDAKAIAALANDIRIAQNTLRIPYPYLLADAKAWLHAVKRQADGATFLVTLRDGTVIGACGVEPLKEGQPELGYWLGTHYWGHGYATEAVRAVVDHAFDEFSYETIYSGARISNPASRRVLEKCGFQWFAVGLYRIRSIASSAPIDRFRLDRGIWSALKNWGETKRLV